MPARACVEDIPEKDITRVSLNIGSHMDEVIKKVEQAIPSCPTGHLQLWWKGSSTTNAPLVQRDTVFSLQKAREYKLSKFAKRSGGYGNEIIF